MDMTGGRRPVHTSLTTGGVSFRGGEYKLLTRQRASSLLPRPSSWRGQYTPFLNQRARVASGGTGADCGLTLLAA